MDPVLYESFEARILVHIRDHVNKAYDDLREEDSKQDEETGKIKQSIVTVAQQSATALQRCEALENYLDHVEKSVWEHNQGTLKVKKAIVTKSNFDIEGKHYPNLEARVEEIEGILQSQRDGEQILTSTIQRCDALEKYLSHVEKSVWENAQGTPNFKNSSVKKSSFYNEPNHANLESRVEQIEQVLESRRSEQLLTSTVGHDHKRSSVIDMIQGYVAEELLPISQAVDLLTGELQSFKADLENVTQLVNTPVGTAYVPVGMSADTGKRLDTQSGLNTATQGVLDEIYPVFVSHDRKDHINTILDGVEGMEPVIGALVQQPAPVEKSTKTSGASHGEVCEDIGLMDPEYYEAEMSSDKTEGLNGFREAEIIGETQGLIGNAEDREAEIILVQTVNPIESQKAGKTSNNKYDWAITRLDGQDRMIAQLLSDNEKCRQALEDLQEDRSKNRPIPRMIKNIIPEPSRFLLLIVCLAASWLILQYFGLVFEEYETMMDTSGYYVCRAPRTRRRLIIRT